MGGGQALVADGIVPHARHEGRIGGQGLVVIFQVQALLRVAHFSADAHLCTVRVVAVPDEGRQDRGVHVLDGELAVQGADPHFARSQANRFLVYSCVHGLLDAFGQERELATVASSNAFDHCNRQGAQVPGTPSPSGPER